MRTFGICITLLALFSCPAAAQESRANRQAVIDVAEADDDYAYQGEYAGWQWDRSRGWMHRGLQVVALGGGKFDAALLDGGLPGCGWTIGRRREVLSGALDGGALVLRGQTLDIVIEPSLALLLDKWGRELGRLSKVARTSPTLGAAPPPGAIVLFPVGQVSNLSSSASRQDKNPSYLSGAKLARDGSLLAGVLTKMPVQAFYMHLEFRTPYMPAARGQGRGNSGVYIQQRYEVQILDSFGLEGLANECGSIYKQARPAVNMCLPPLAWQTYDIWFTPPRFAADGRTKLANALITVLHNGIPIHSYRQVTNKTGGGKQEGPDAYPINLQDHGNPVTFRNIWLVAGDGHAAAYHDCQLSPRRSRWLGRRQQ